MKSLDYNFKITTATCMLLIAAVPPACGGGSSDDGGGGGKSEEQPPPSPPTCAEDPPACSDSAHCFDTVNGPTCVCNKGFAGNGVVCNDINECVDGVLDGSGNKVPACDADATCENSVGTFKCECPEGYTGDGKTCEPMSCGFNVGLCPEDAGPDGYTCVRQPGAADGICQPNKDCADPGYFADCECMADKYCPGPYWSCGPGSLSCK